MACLLGLYSSIVADALQLYIHGLNFPFRLVKHVIVARALYKAAGSLCKPRSLVYGIVYPWLFSMLFLGLVACYLVMPMACLFSDIS